MRLKQTEQTEQLKQTEQIMGLKGKCIEDIYDCIDLLTLDTNDDKALVYMYNYIVSHFKNYIANKCKYTFYCDESDAIITNTILRLQKSIHKWDSEKGEFKNWLQSVITNEFGMYYGKNFKRNNKIDYFPSTMVSNDEYKPSLNAILYYSTNLLTTDEKSVVPTLIGLLKDIINDIGNPRYKGIMLDYVDGLKYVEIFHKYEGKWALGTIKTIISTEKEKYKKHIVKNPKYENIFERA